MLSNSNMDRLSNGLDLCCFFFFVYFFRDVVEKKWANIVDNGKIEDEEMDG